MERLINVVAKAIYETHWNVNLPNDRFPPVWQNASPDVKNWIREQAISAIHAVEKFQD